MDMQGALRARLVAAVGGMVWAHPTTGAKAIYWVDRPQAAGLPAVTLQIISDLREQHLKGFQSIRETRVQIDCWADTYAQVTTLKEAVLAAVIPEQSGNGIRFHRAIIDGERDLGERTETKFIHRASVDLVVFWTTT